MQENENNLISNEHPEENNVSEECVDNTETNFINEGAPSEEIIENIVEKDNNEEEATDSENKKTETNEAEKTVQPGNVNNTYYYEPRVSDVPPPPPPPFPPYPYPPYPHVKKPKLNTASKVFIILLAVLYGISSFATVGAMIYTIIEANTPKNNSNSYYPGYSGSYPDYEDFFGEFEDYFGEGEQYPDFGGGNGGNGDNGGSGNGNGNENKKPESEAENSKPSENYVQPDIEYSPNLDGITINNKPSSEPLSAEEVYKKVIKSTVSVYAKIPLADGSYENSSGTGIIITEDGFIITNSHVIGNTKSTYVTVITEDGTEQPAIIAAFDKATDLAVLKVDATDLTPAEFGNDEELNIGEWVIAIGSPGGVGFSGSLTRGVISGLDRVIDTTETSNITYIQTDAVINPGNSGGPLVNMYGQVVGINTSKIAADAYEGMGFSIPTTDAKAILDQLLASGYVEGRVRVGITGQNNVQGNPYGVIIIEFDETGSSFDGTLAKVNDIIIGMDGKKIQSLNDLTTALQKYKAGDKAKVTLYRPSTGNEVEVEIVLLPDAGETQR